MKTVTAIGSVFFKCADPKKMNAWYEEHLGMPVTDWGAMFEWRELENPEQTGYTVWSTFPADAEQFGPSGKDFMINYRVENIEDLVRALKDANVTVLDDITDSEYGKFVHILDPEGNSIELFEPSA